MKTKKPVILLVGAMMTVLLVFGSSVPGVRAADRPAELYQQASQQFWDGQYDQALRAYRSIVDGYPDHELYWDAQFGIAKSYYGKGEMTRAAEVFRMVQQNHPEKNVRGDALFSLVEVAILQDEIIKARNLLRTFLDVYDDHPIRKTARQQLALLERTPTAQPADVAPPEGKGSAPGADQPPTLKSAGDQEKPEALPTTDSSQQRTDTRPVTPPPMRGVADTSPTDDTKSRVPDDTGTESVLDTEPESPEGDTAPSGRINPIGIPEPSSDTTPDTGSTADTDGTESGGEASRPSDTAADTASEVAKPETVTDTGTPRDDAPEETGGDASGSPTAAALRKKLEKRLAEGQNSDAFQIAKKLTERSNVRPEDYYRAAELSHRVDNPVETSLDYLNKATALSSGTPGRYLLLKAELLLSDKRREQVASLLATYFGDYYEDGAANQQARYHFLKGELLRARNQDDEAFFQYMSVMQTAPDSRWGQRAQTTLNNQY